MLFLPQENQANINESFILTTWYLNNLLNIANEYFEQMLEII